MNKLVLLTGLLIACGGPAAPPVAPAPASSAPRTAAAPAPTPPAAREPPPAAPAAPGPRAGPPPPPHRPGRRRAPAGRARVALRPPRRQAGDRRGHRRVPRPGRRRRADQVSLPQYRSRQAQGIADRLRVHGDRR